MSNFLKRITPLVLLTMAALVFLEPVLPGVAGIRSLIGENGVMRFALGILCIYVMLLVIERQSLDAKFTGVLDTFKQFYAARAGAGAGAGREERTDAEMEAAKDKAVPILLAALESDQADVREMALENLQRLTGKDLGTDVEAWKRHLAALEAPETPETQE